MPLLTHEFVVDDDAAAPDRWMLILHGILGRRANWRTFARRWVQARLGWGAVLVDLRDHGESQDLDGPRTIAAAAADLVELSNAIIAGTVAGVIGHSFGGKVAIAAAAQLRAAGRPLEELWVIDAPPGPRTQPRDRTTERTFELLAALPERFTSRSQFIDAVMAGGIAKGVAQWLATNLVDDADTDGPSWRFGLNLDRLRQLLDDFAAVDLWPQLEAEAAAGTHVALVFGGRSEAVYGAELEHAQALANAGVIALEVIANAGHWVHVDQPDALLGLLARPPAKTRP
jgi:pimeloyl-ACP methyl ester carboxylesterase